MTLPASAKELKAEVSTTSVTVIVIVCVLELLAGSIAVKTKSYTLFPPLSEGASKLGEVLNLTKAVTESDVTMLNKAASAPDEIVTVADSETTIVAALEDVAKFSAAENEEEVVKVGGVVSAAALATIVT